MYKKVIKIFCIFLSAVIVFSSSLPCFADSGENDKTIHSSDYPTIIITGYFMPGLYENYGTKDQKEILICPAPVTIIMSFFICDSSVNLNLKSASP